VATGAVVSGYTVSYSTTGGAPWSAAGTTSASTTSILVTGLTNATLYTVKVVPNSSSGDGPAAAATATPAAPTVLPPGAVRSLAGTNIVASILTWTAPTASAAAAAPTGYAVQRSTDNTSWTTLTTTLSASTLTYTATGLATGTKYYFRVFGTSTVGNGTTATITVTPTAASQYQTVAGAPTWSSAGLAMNGGSSVLSYNTKANVTITATGSMATTPVGNGYGLWVRASFANNALSGYCFQLDRGYSNEFILRWWTDGKERGTPWARAKFSAAFPGGFDLDAQHTTSVNVTDNNLTATVDGVVVMTTALPTQDEIVNSVPFVAYTVDKPAFLDKYRYGLRTWSSNAVTFTTLTAS
jgi:hypothetical protein